MSKIDMPSRPGPTVIIPRHLEAALILVRPSDPCTRMIDLLEQATAMMTAHIARQRAALDRLEQQIDRLENAL